MTNTFFSVKRSIKTPFYICKGGPTFPSLLLQFILGFDQFFRTLKFSLLNQFNSQTNKPYVENNLLKTKKQVE